MSPDDKLRQYHLVRQTANRLLDEYGLSASGWHFHMNNNQRRLGYCSHRDKRISLSQHYIYTNGENWRNTLLHEIAHALVGPGHKHDAVWQAKCREIGARPVALAHPSVKTNAKPNYEIRCPSCGWFVKRFRMKSRNFGSTCPKCGTEVEIFKLTYRPKSGNDA